MWNIVHLSTTQKSKGGFAMKHKTKIKTLNFLIFLSFILCGCIAVKYKPAPNMVDLEISFTDSLWNGKKVPAGQQCSRFGGNGATPPLMVKNIPAGANALIMEYSDRDSQYRYMDNGGHGKIGYNITPGTKQVTIPSVPGHTFDLPKGFFLVSAHQAPNWDKAGAYMPPCSGGKENLYYVTVKAVYDAPEGKESQLLGKGRLTLGRY
jgi:hypothetical protein